VGRLRAKLAQLGLLGLMLLAVGAQVPVASAGGSAAGLFSLPARSVDTSTESNSVELLSGTSRFKSIPRPDWPFTPAATAGIVVRPDAQDVLPGGGTPDIFRAYPYAHSGRAPPSV
jgi:hypothetical protein